MTPSWLGSEDEEDVNSDVSLQSDFYCGINKVLIGWDMVEPYYADTKKVLCHKNTTVKGIKYDIIYKILLG